MDQRQKRRVYIGLTVLLIALFAGGIIAGYVGRHTPICKDGRPPVAQHDTGIGQVAYRCHNGQIVVK